MNESAGHHFKAFGQRAQQSWQAHREGLLPITFLAALVLLFAVTTVLARNYRQQRHRLAEVWYGRGTEDLDGHRPDAAIDDFRTALYYSPNNPQYELDLARALLLVRHSEEARVYLETVWQDEPENAVVNLQLARIAASRNAVDQALRYYHNAVYGVWPQSADLSRRAARRELIDYLLRSGLRDQADAELMRLASVLPNSATAHDEVGSLMLQSRDYSHALSEFRTALVLDRHDSQAMAGAGEAQFHMANYRLARNYLQRAVAADPANAEAQSTLATTRLVLQLSPLLTALDGAERYRRLEADFNTAAARLQACSPRATGETAVIFERLNQQAQALGTDLSSPKVAADPAEADRVLAFALAVEKNAEAACGPATGADLALLLIASEQAP
jgi:tetratricopeptide (TPR) repeat protein